MTKNGRPIVALLGAKELSSLRETLDVLSDPELMRQIRASRKEIVRKAQRYSFEELFQEPLIVRDRRKKSSR